MPAGVNCGKIDTRQFPEDEKIIFGNVAWVKADVEEKIYFWQNSPAVVLKISAPLIAQYCPGQTNWLPTVIFALDALDSSLLAASGNRPAPSNDPGDAATSGTDNEKSPNINFCGVLDNGLLEGLHNGLDAYSMNDKGSVGVAVMPTAAAIPMKSNVLTYGPYASANFSTSFGGTEVRVEPDLCPWVFGSFSTMEIVGQNIANTLSVGLNRAETGQVTIPGLPDFVGTLGFTLGNGPNLTSISCNLGSGGASTTYEFKTFTPKLGDFSRIFIEQLKYNTQKRAEQLKILRQDQINNNKNARKIATVRSALNKLENYATKNPTQQASLNRILIGESYDWPILGNNYEEIGLGQRIVVGIDTMAKSVTESIFNYGSKAFATLDSIFSPVSINGGGTAPNPSTPGWITPYSLFQSSVDAVKSSPILPVPPVKNRENSSKFAHNTIINRNYLNPLTNSFKDGYHHHDGDGAGHCVEIVGRESNVPISGVLNSLYRKNDPAKYSDDYRFLGLRGPLVLHSWGYDLEGKPIPNAIDNEIIAKSGKFVSTNDIDFSSGNPLATGLQDQFLTDWLSKPATWPVGPIDLRFDRARGVWVSPPSHKIAVVQATENIDVFGKGSGILINSNDLEQQQYGSPIIDSDGKKVQADNDENKNKTLITIADRLGQGIGAGEKGYAFFDGFNSEYLIFGGGSPIRIGKFCNQWPSLSNVVDPLNAIKKVVLYRAGEDPWDLQPETEIIDGIQQPKTVEAINIFANVAAAEYQTKWCAMVKFGSTYFLIAAEC